MSIEGVFLARLTGGGLMLLIVFFFIILPKCKFKIDIKSIEKSIRFGFPLVISNIGYTLFLISDRIMLNWLSTNEQVGKYGFGFRIANFINLIFVQTIGMSYFPSVMSNESKQDNIRYYRKMLTYYCFLMGFLILAFLLFYKDILVIMGKDIEYWEGLKVVPILALSFMIMGMNYFVGVGLFLKNQTKYYLIPSFTAASINITMNFILIPKYGMMGAAYSVVIGQIVYTSLLTYFSGKHLKINFEWLKISLIYVLAIGMYWLDQLVSNDNFVITTLIKLSLLALFPFILYKLKFFEQIEIQRFKEGLVKIFFKVKSI
jgi:O-antigen/teichoic acid export membrane protein